METTIPTPPGTTGATPTMAAIVQDRYGDDPRTVLRHDRIGRPGIRDDEVLVRVRAAGVDRGTWHLMAGRPYLMRAIGFGFRGPKTPVPGLDLAGTVEAVGANVTAFAVGDEVFGTAASGSFAQYAVAKADKLAAKPGTLTFEQAAAVPVSATTALQAVRDKGGVQAGDRVLVIGASGGVGSYAVQIAKAFGAHVTGVARTSKLDLVRALGADAVLDYTRDEVTDGRRRYDVVVDIGGNRPVRELRRALTPRGRLVITGGEGGGSVLGGIGRNLRAALLSMFVGQKLTAFVARQRGDDLVALRELVETGALVPALDGTYPLAAAADAMCHLVEGRARGKVVVTV